jgi:hypothetical protein
LFTVTASSRLPDDVIFSLWCTTIRAKGLDPITIIQGLGTSDCKTELCTRHLVANSGIDRRAPNHRSPLSDSLVSSYRTLAIGCAKAL